MGVWNENRFPSFPHNGSAVFMSEAKMVRGIRRWFFLTSPYSGSCSQAYWHHAHICMYIRNMTFSMFASLPAFFCFLHKYPKCKVEKNRITATESNIYVMIHVKFVCLLEKGNSIFYRKTVSLELFWCLGDAYLPRTVCEWICVHVCVVCVNAHMHVCSFVHANVCACECMSMCLCQWVSMCVWVSVYEWVCVHACMCVHMCVYVCASVYERLFFYCTVAFHVTFEDIYILKIYLQVILCSFTLFKISVFLSFSPACFFFLF